MPEEEVHRSNPDLGSVEEGWLAVEMVMDRAAELLPCHLHPESEEIERQAVNWFDHAHLIDDPARRLRLSEFGRGTAAAYPWVSYDEALFWARLSLWYIAFDDVHAEGQASRDLTGYFQQVGGIWRMLHEAWPQETFEGPFPAALAQLLEQLDVLVSPTIATRIRQSLRDSLFAVSWEAVMRAGNTAPAQNDYLVLRRHSCYGSLNLEFLELSSETFLDDRARRDPRTREIRVAACDLLTAVNDLYSARFEEQKGILFRPVPSSLSPIQQKVDEARRCLAHARTVADLRDATAATPPLGAFCAAVAQWAAGVFWWHRKVQLTRYLNPGSDRDSGLEKGGGR
ncbi:MAG: terpene synthase family protein [Pseudonocardiaceae bacterium]